MKRANDLLRDGAALFEERNAKYGDTYLNFGKLMVILCPDGWNLTSVEDWNRAAIVMQKVTKLMRYLHDPKQPHLDSVDDDMVYSAMLFELDLALTAIESASSTMSPNLPSEGPAVWEEPYHGPFPKVPESPTADELARVCLPENCEHIWKRDLNNPKELRCPVCWTTKSEWEQRRSSL